MKKFRTILSAALIIFSLSFVFTSCEKDPVKPVDETGVKDHEDPFKAELLFVEGHLHGTYGFHQNPEYNNDVKHMRRIQKITFELTSKGWGPAKGSADKFLVRGTPKESSVYALWIKYFNKEGKEMTSQFIQNGQDKIHQHFFIPKEVKPSLYGKEESSDKDPSALFDYLYCDSDPWDKSYSKDEGTKLIGDKNPIGFKGYFKFKKSYKQFILDIRLLHANSSKFGKDGKASPFYKPTSAQLQNDQWDLSMRVPVIIYNDSYENIDDPKSLKGKAEKDISEKDMKLLKAAAKAYGITWQEALQDYIGKENTDTDPESGNLWF